MSSSSNSESNDYEDMDQLGKLEKLKSLRDQFNCEIQDERREFIRQLRPLIRNWTDELPDLRDIFRPADIDWLLEESVRSNARFLNSETTPFVKFVIDAGYKDEPKFDEDGKPLLLRETPLHHAFNEHIIGQLFKIYDRFDVNYINEHGISHFHLACRLGCTDLAKKFLEFGQDPNGFVPESNAGFTRTPLHCALHFEHWEVVELLLRSGADPNMVDKWGSTPLHVICRGEDDDLAEFFFKVNDELKQKVLVDVRNHEGLTPLQSAVSNLLPNVVDVLLNRGADLTSFVLPTASVFVVKFVLALNRLKYNFVRILFKLRLASGAMIVVERLEKRGYEMGRDDALTIMHFFAAFDLFKEPESFNEGWFNDEEFAELAKMQLIIPTKRVDESSERPASLTLYDLIRLRPEEAAKRLAYADYFGLWRSSVLWSTRRDSRNACICARY